MRSQQETHAASEAGGLDAWDWAWLLGLLGFIWLLHCLRLGNLNIWEHLKMGEIIVGAKRIPATRDVLWTAPKHFWVAQSWLFEVAVYLLYRAGGVVALYAWDTLLAWAVLWVWYGWWRRERGSRLVGAWLTVLGVIAVADRYQIRPEVCTALGLALLVRILGEYKQGRRRSLWVLLPLGVVWANVHAGIVMGEVVVALFVAAEAVGHLPWLRQRLAAETIIEGPRMRHLLLLGAAFGLTSLFTPNGWTLYTWLLSQETRTMVSMVVENQPLWWWTIAERAFVPAAALAVLLVGVVFLLAARGRRAPLHAWALLGVFLMSAMRMARQVWPFVTVALGAVVLPGAGAGARTPKRAIGRRPSRWGAVAAWCVLVGVMACGVADRWGAGKGYGARVGIGRNPEFLPIGAADWLVRHGPPGRLFNTFQDSCYLVFRLYPKYQLLVDGFTDYPIEVYQVHQAILAAPNPGPALAAAGVDIVVLGPGPELSRFAQRLEATREWVALYGDGVSTVYLRERPDYRPAMGRWGYHAVSFASVAPASEDKAEVEAEIDRIAREGVPSEGLYIFLGVVLERIGEPGAARAEYEKAARMGNDFAGWRLAELTGNAEQARRLKERVMKSPGSRAAQLAAQFAQADRLRPPRN